MHEGAHPAFLGKTRNAGCVAAVQRFPLAMGRTVASAAAGHLAVEITQHVKEQRIGSTTTELKSGHPRYRGHLNDGKLQKRFKRVLPCFRLMCKLLRRAKLPRTASKTMIMPAKIILFRVKSKSFSQIMILIGFICWCRGILPLSVGRANALFSARYYGRILMTVFPVGGFGGECRKSVYL